MDGGGSAHESFLGSQHEDSRVLALGMPRNLHETSDDSADSIDVVTTLISSSLASPEVWRQTSLRYHRGKTRTELTLCQRCNLSLLAALTHGHAVRSTSPFTSTRTQSHEPIRILSYCSLLSEKKSLPLLLSFVTSVMGSLPCQTGSVAPLLPRSHLRVVPQSVVLHT